MPTSAGENTLIGITVELDSRGVLVAARQMKSFSRTTKKASDQIGRSMDNVTAKIQAAAAAAAIGFGALRAGQLLRDKVLAPMLSEAKTFEVEFAQLEFVSGAVGKDLDKLRQKVIETGLATQFSPQEATEALRRLKAAGLDLNTAVKELQPTLDLATASAGKIGLGEAASTTAALMKKFGDRADGARSVLSAFAEATRQTNLQWEDLRPLVRSAGSAIQKMDMRPAEFFAFSGSLRNIGKTAADSGNVLQAFGRQIGQIEKAINRQERLEARATKTGRKSNRLVRQNVFWWRKLKTSMFDAQGNFLGATKAVRGILEGIKGLANQQERAIALQSILGTNSQDLIVAFLDMDKAVKEGKPSFEDLIAQFDKAAASQTLLREAAEKFENTFEGLLRFISGQMATLAVLFGEELIASIFGPVKMVRRLIGQFVALVRENPVLRKALLTTIVVLTSLSLVAGTATLALAGLAAASAFMLPALAAVGGLTGVFAEAMTGLGTLAAKVGPTLLKFGRIFGGLAFLFVLFNTAITENLGGFGDSFTKLFGNLLLVAKGFFTFFSGGIFKGAEEVALAKELHEKNLDKFLLTLLQWKERVFRIGRGIVAGVSLIFKGFALVLTPVFFALGAVLDLFTFVLEQFEAGDITNTLVMWESFGVILGVVAGVKLLAVGVAMAQTTLGLIKQGFVLAKTAVMWVFNTAMIVKNRIATLLATKATILLSRGSAIAATASIGVWIALGAVVFIAGMAIGILVQKFLKFVGIIDKDTPNLIESFKEIFNLFSSEGSLELLSKAFDFGKDLAKRVVNGAFEIFGKKGPFTDILGDANRTSRRGLPPAKGGGTGPISSFAGPATDSTGSFFTPVGQHSSPGPRSAVTNQSTQNTTNATFSGGIQVSIQNASRSELEKVPEILMSVMQNMSENEAETAF